MAIKAGQILHDVNGFVVDRIQTGGVSSLNIPEEKIYETGNSASVTTVRDTADLSFELESFDVSTEMEALVTGVSNPAAEAQETSYDFKQAVPLYVVSPFKTSLSAYTIVKGIAIPHLTLESVSYKFGITSNSSQTFSFKGDTVNYIPGSPYYEEITLVNNTLTYSLAQTALIYTEQGNSLYVLGACAVNPTTKAYKRLTFGVDYTNTSTSITTVADLYDSDYTKLRLVYGSATQATYGTGVHQGVAVKPGAVRGKDICVFVTTSGATPVGGQWTGIQSVDVNWKVNLEADREFCNAKVLGYDYDVPEVSGSITVRAVDVADLWAKIAQVGNVSTSVVAGLTTSTAMNLEIQIKHPDTGVVLKTLVVPDARFTLPNIQARVQQKLEVTFNFTSDGGLLTVSKGNN
jgi:hypothetical protein